MHAYRHRGRPELKLTVRALHRSSSRIPTVWCTLGPGSGRSRSIFRAYLPRAFLRPSQRAERTPSAAAYWAACQGAARTASRSIESRCPCAFSLCRWQSRPAARSASRPTRSCRLGAPSPGVPAQCHRGVPELGEGVSTHESWRPRWIHIRISVPRGFGCLPLHSPCTPFPPALLPCPHAPARWIAGGVAAETAEDHCGAGRSQCGAGGTAGPVPARACVP